MRAIENTTSITAAVFDYVCDFGVISRVVSAKTVFVCGSGLLLGRIYYREGVVTYSQPTNHRGTYNSNHP